MLCIVHINLDDNDNDNANNGRCKMTNGKEKPEVKLTGEDGNAFAIMGRVTGVLRKAGWSKEAIKEYTDKAMSGDYDHLLQITMEYVDVI